MGRRGKGRKEKGDRGRREGMGGEDSWGVGKRFERGREGRR